VSEEAQREEAQARPMPLVLMLIAGLFLGPGAGHFLVKKWKRGLIFAAAFFAITALLKVLSATQPSPITMALLWLPLVLRLLALVDLVRIPPEERTSEKLVPALLGAVGMVVAWQGVERVSLAYVTQPFVMPSGGMHPTIAVGDYFVVSKLLPPPKRGDVVVVGEPEKPAEQLAKRVIGIGGDHIENTGSSFRINGDEVPVCELGTFDYDGRPYRLVVEGLGSPHLVMLSTGERASESRSWDVPPGQLFVVGDNRDNSHDSRSWFGGKGGAVSETLLAGSVTFFMQRGGGLRVQDVRRIELPKGAEGLRDKVQPCLDELGYKP
jgi:signal peptidase I